MADCGEHVVKYESSQGAAQEGSQLAARSSLDSFEKKESSFIAEVSRGRLQGAKGGAEYEGGGGSEFKTPR